MVLCPWSQELKYLREKRTLRRKSSEEIHILDASDRSATVVNNTIVLKNRMHFSIENLEALKELNKSDMIPYTVYLFKDDLIQDYTIER